jgi:hypothetical protein
MKNSILLSSIICLLIMGITGDAQSSQKPIFVSLIVDMDVPAFANEDQLNDAKNNMLNISDIMRVASVTPTLVLTTEASEKARGLLGQVTSEINPDVAMSGNHSNELLSTKSYLEQKDILEKSKFHAEKCNICGTNEVKVKGFMPQSFDQNDDTYRVLDDLGIKYNAGFQAGTLYAPGHENDVWPYKVENHKFYAVPVSTYDFSGELIPLDDRYIANNGISASQWENLLIEKFDAISGKDEPMVISLSTSISGSKEYLNALAVFLTHALKSNNARFVTADELVEISSNEFHDLPSASATETAQETEVTTPSIVTITSNASSNASSYCPECEEIKNAAAINSK